MSLALLSTILLLAASSRLLTVLWLEVFLRNQALCYNLSEEPQVPQHSLASIAYNAPGYVDLLLFCQPVDIPKLSPPALIVCDSTWKCQLMLRIEAPFNFSGMMKQSQ